MPNKKQNLNNLEPIPGEPGWYFNHSTGQIISEDDLGGTFDADESQLLEDQYSDEGFDEGAEDGDFKDYEDYGNEEDGSDGDDSESDQREKDPEDDGSDDEQGGGSKEGSPDSEPKHPEGKKKLPNADGPSPSDALNALPTDQMGEAGEKIDQAKDLMKDAEDLAKVIESEGADLAADWRLLKKYGPEAIKKQLMMYGLIVGGYIVTFTLIVIFIMALLGYGDDGAYGTTPGNSDYATSEKCEKIFNETGITLPTPNSVGFVPLPSFSYYTSYVGTSRQWGQPKTIKTIVCVSKQWGDLGETGPKIGDLSLEFGGPMSGHKSHQKGTSADIDHPEAIDWYTSEKSGVINTNFKVTKSIELAKLFIAAGVRKIGFQHPEVIKEVNKWAEENNYTGRVYDWSNHKSHFHIEL
ncbi:MAG: penicillin-insensitive murein endopeptidase [Patescibacteria group bacterium]|nr:penicillin-insensitive murein endopeptidase [Patescibacteria group bacterium]